MRWYVVLLFALLYILSFVDRLILALLIEPLKAELHISDTQAGLLIGTAFALLYACLGLPIAWLVDRGNRTRIAFVGIMAWSVATIASGFVGNFAELVPLRTGLALGEAVLSPVYVSLIVDYFARERRALPMVIFGASGITGATVAYSIGGGIVDLYQRGAFRAWPVIGDLSIWRATLVLVGLPGVLLALLLFFTTKDPPRSAGAGQMKGQAASLAGGLFADAGEMLRFYIPFLVGSAFLQTIIYATLAWYPTYLIRTFAFPIARSGYLFSLALSFGAVITLCYPVLVRQMTKRGRPDILSPTQLTVLPVGGALYVASLAMDTPQKAIALMVVGLGLMVGVSSLPSIVVGMTAPPGYSARLLAANVACQNLIGLAIGPAGAAFLSEHVFGGALATALITVLAICLPLFWILVFLSWRPYRAALGRVPREYAAA
jgi:MFS family permease